MEWMQEKNTQYPPKDVPRSSVAVYVGNEQEQQTRFVNANLVFQPFTLSPVGERS